MYFPYFRGRQYDLIALKELAQSGLLGESVIPVIEPVKLTSTLYGTLKAFIDKNLPIAIIYNPAVGNLSENYKEVTPLYSYLAANFVIPSVLVNRRTADCLDALEEKGVSKDNILAILDNRDSLVFYLNEFEHILPRYTLFPDERQIRRAVKQNKVMFENKFNKKLRNADYPEDEFFSEDHLYFVDEGYAGFSDYSIIGDEYTEKGYAPYAVAIHIIYFADDNTLRIRHFLSDTNEDTTDVAGKFYEAVSKLADWYYNGQTRQLTLGLETLLHHHSKRTYPGLPTLKKLSIMHHLELVGSFLDKEHKI